MYAVMQRAAQRNVDFLNAAANAENRHARSDAGAYQRQDERIAARIDHFVGRKCRSVVVMRLDIRAPTREQDAVHA